MAWEWKSQLTDSTNRPIASLMRIATRTMTVKMRKTRMTWRKARNLIEGMSRVKKGRIMADHQHHENVLEGDDGDNLVNLENGLLSLSLERLNA